MAEPERYFYCHDPHGVLGWPGHYGAPGVPVAVDRSGGGGAAGDSTHREESVRVWPYLAVHLSVPRHAAADPAVYHLLRCGPDSGYPGHFLVGDFQRAARSEERRVGKECRSRW